MTKPALSAGVLLLALSLFAVQAAPTGGAGDEIVERTLANGLKVVVWPDHDIPNVAQYTWFRAGGRNEYPGITGLAHYFEHMMFNGTTTLEPGEFDRIMEAAGGANNAYTSHDVTVYQDWYPAGALTTIFRLEADRMANLSFDPGVIESERGVVYSERRTSVDNNNFRALMEKVQATAFLAHPYQFPVIGWPSDIETWSREDLTNFYRTYYAPNNAVMFVVGDVEPAGIFALAEEYYGGIPAQPAPEPITTIEPPQQGERRLILRRPGQTPMLQMVWHSGEADAEGMPALEVLVTLLVDGESSILHQALVEQQLAIETGGFIHQGFDPGLTWIYATLPPHADPAAVEKRITAVLGRIAEDGVSEDQLRKAKNMLTANYWRQLATISGKAQALGTYEVFHGDWRKLFDAPAAWEAVTREQVRDVAARIFRKENRTVGILEPVLADE
ncbi:MAG TPA: pitrilysin family protein [Gammaproteobacteria bacterium]